MDKDTKLVLRSFLLWRILLFIPLLLAPYFMPLREGFTYNHLNSNLFSPWANFDGVHFLSIARDGYITQATFFPFYSVVIRLFAFGSDGFISGLIISNISFLLALILLYKIVKSDFNKNVARWTMLFILVFPTSFFFASVYSESLFLLLLLLSFKFAKEKKWIWAAVSGVFLSSTRLVGAALSLALFIKHKKFIFLLIPLGTAIYALFNYFRWNDPLHFIKMHGELSNGRSVDSIILFPQTVYRYIKILLYFSASNVEWWIALLELSAFFLGALLLFKAYKHKVNYPYLVFSVLAFLVPISTGTFSSLPRYLIVLFPIYISLAQIKNNKIKVGIAMLFSILLFVLLMLFSRGYFVA